jgi:type II secretory pathway pseudopilin PulG
MLRRFKERGDTLIEVLFAISVFSFVVVSSLAIMNQGTSAAQRSVEITLVRQQIDAQAETLRFMHDSYVAVYQSQRVFLSSDTSPAAQWDKMLKDIDPAKRTASNVSECPAKTPANSFVVDPYNVRYYPAADKDLPGTEFAQIKYNSLGGFDSSNGLWIEAIRSVTNTGDNGNQLNTGFIDFHILACWESPGTSISSSQGTIVRLYEPRG